MNKLFVVIKNFRTVWTASGLEKVEKNRVQMRHQFVTVKIQGKAVEMAIMKYIDLVASEFTKIVDKDGKAVDHKQKMRQIYYRYGWRGLKFYIKRMKRLNNKAYKQIKKSLKTPKA